MQETPARHYLGVKEPLTATRSAAPADIATEYLHGLAPELGLSSGDLTSVFIAKQYRTQFNGVTHIIFRQQYAGAEVLNAEWVVNVDRDGRVLNAGGNLYPAPSMNVLPIRSRAQLAAKKAVAAVNPKLAATFQPVESAMPARNLRNVRFAANGLAADAEGEPVWFASKGELRQAWKFFVADEDRVHRYSVTIADWDLQVLRNQPLTFFQTADPNAPRGMVFERESPQPNPTPGVRLSGPPAIVSRSMQSFLGDPVASPLKWTNGLQTAGNNVVAGENLLGTDFIRPTPSEGTSGNFSFPLQLGPGTNPMNYRDAANTNLFYWMNRAHDLHYQYGFDEAAGNFQNDNFGRGGVGGDAIYAYTHYGARALGTGDFENAFFTLTDTGDGSQPEVSMFLSAATGAAGDFLTDGSYDSVVMVHEYTHGVSFRLARNVYTTFQGASMGEAWSDFFGLEYTLPNGANPDGIYPTGEYFDQSWGVGDVRSRPYSTDMNLNPLTFANLGHVISRPEVHADGEIWFEALWEIRSNLIKQFGEAEGRKRVRQLVMDGMKLQVPAATMVDARDGILLADRVDFKGASQDQLWAGFAKRGLGALALSSGGTTIHVAPSFDLPSTAGAVRFYDSSMVAGEPARVVLEDNNYTQPSVLVQVTSSSGDVENLILKKTGSVYVGTIGTTLGAVVKQNGRVEMAPGDYLDVYYVDFNTGSGAKLITSSAKMMQPYQATATANSYLFTGETRVSVSTFARVQLPFEFPFFDKQYGTALVYANGLVAFDTPVTTTSCTDYNALSQFPAIAPLWNPLSLAGRVLANEGLFMSKGTDSITFRWAGENTALGEQPTAVNFAATLFSDGRVQFNYGTGNQTVTSSSRFATCGTGPAVGISNGHDVYTANYTLPTYDSGLTLHLDPPFNAPSAPVAVLQSPKSGDHVQDILTVSGTVSDSAAVVLLPVDIFIDNVERTRVSAVQGTFTATLDLIGLGITPGVHTLKIRASNGRGAIAEFPGQPVAFTVDPGRAALPVISLEQPAEGAVITDSLVVSGYAYDQTLRITSVDTLIDGFVPAPTSYGVRRNDICDPLTTKPLNCPNVGFSGSFQTVQSDPPIPNGAHTVQVRVRDQAGRLFYFPDTPVNITVKNKAIAPIVGVLDSPVSNARLSGTVTVAGYVYAPGQKILAALIVVDGVSYGAVKLGQPRADVCATLPNADACPNIGYTVDFDTRRLLNGTHILGIYALTDQGIADQFPKLVNGGIDVFVQN